MISTVIVFAAAAMGLAQDAAVPPDAAASQVTPPMEWQVFSESRTTAYLIDVGSISPADDATTFRIAKVPKDRSAASDIAWRAEDLAIRCQQDQFRSLATTEFSADGSVLDRYDGEDIWDPVEGVYASGIKEFACDGARTAGESFPTLAAFIASLR